MNNPALLYTSFDVVPAPKGAAVHIEQFAKGLCNTFQALQLATVSPSDFMNERSLWSGVNQVEIPAIGEDLISRVIHFRRFFASWLRDKQYDCVQFRSPFEGLVFARDKALHSRHLVFEVNALPSIELKYRYPNVADDDALLAKLRWQEDLCLSASDLIIVTCEVTKNFLTGVRQVPSEKIEVIPNGVALENFAFAPPRSVPDDEPIQLLYFGTLSAWQGLELAIRALALVAQETAAHLTVIGPSNQRQIESLAKLAGKLGVGDLVSIMPAVSQEQLVHHAHESHAILAPLSANDRNLEQGCCPLKILEGMATGTPVIASDLPVVREIAGEDCVIYAKSNSVNSWKERIMELRTHSSVHSNAQMTSAARERIERFYTWSMAQQKLTEGYLRLLELPLESVGSKHLR